MKRVFYVVLVILTILSWSCKAQSKGDTILQTSKQVIKAIQQNNVEKFKSLIEFKDLGDISKDEEMVKADVKDLNDLFSRYYEDKEPPIEITYLYNGLGQMLVKVPICDTFHDSIAIDVKKIHLDLLFGPSNLFPLNKITGYGIVTDNYDRDSIDFKPLSYWKERGIAK